MKILNDVHQDMEGLEEYILGGWYYFPGGWWDVGEKRSNKINISERYPW